jgi:transposase
MALKRRRFTREFKLQVLREIEAGKSIAQAAREHELHPNLITRWRSLQSEYAQDAFAGNGNPYKQEARIAELERMVGRLTLENDFLKKALSHLEVQRRKADNKKP